MLSKGTLEGIIHDVTTRNLGRRRVLKFRGCLDTHFCHRFIFSESISNVRCDREFLSPMRTIYLQL